MKNHLYSLFLIGIIISCGYKKPNLKNPETDAKNPSTAEKIHTPDLKNHAPDVKTHALIVEFTANERTQIFRDKYVTTPDTSFQLNNNELIFLKKESTENWDVFFKLRVFNKIGNNWGISKDTSISSGPWGQEWDSINLIQINNQHYLYYEEYTRGGSMGNHDIEFTLFKLNSSEKFFIHYTKVPTGGIVWTNFKKSKNLDSNQIHLSFLEEKVNNSPRVYRPNSEEKLIRQFLIENERALIEIYRQYSVNKPIKFTPVNTDEFVFDINDIKPIKGIATSVANSIQNDDFILISIFKGPVIGYNKTTSEYFCAWVPKSNYDWVEVMKFDKIGNLILFNRDFEPEYLINLYNSTYIRLL